MQKYTCKFKLFSMSKKPSKPYLVGKNANKNQFVFLLDALKATFKNHASKLICRKERRYKIQQMERKKKTNQTKRSRSSDYGLER